MVRPGPRRLVRLAWTIAVVGSCAAVAAAAGDPAGARAAASQDWPPFALVTGLLLVGMVAAEDGVFLSAGAALAAMARRGVVLFVGAAVLVAVVTAVLNLDTSVAFLTPVLVAAARTRAGASAAGPAVLEQPLLYGCLLLSNAASLLLPGSNLTNLIVLGHLHMSGARFATRMAPGWAVAVVVTAVVVGVAHRRGLWSERVRRGSLSPVRPNGVIGLAAVAGSTGTVVALGDPALPVLAIGVTAVALQAVSRPGRVSRSGRASRPAALAARRVADAVGGPVLPGLLGVAIAAGTVGRAWSGPMWLLGHAGSAGAAAVSAGAAITVNNLPAASLLAARRPPHPFAVLVGLDIGPNLLVTGSLSSLLWWRRAVSAGARPSLRRVTVLGLLSAPLAAAGALGLLVLTGAR